MNKLKWSNTVVLSLACASGILFKTNFFAGLFTYLGSIYCIWEYTKGAQDDLEGVYRELEEDQL